MVYNNKMLELKNVLLSRLERTVKNPEILITPEVDIVLKEVAQFGIHDHFVNYDKKTRIIQDSKQLGIEGLANVYARRLVLGSYFEGRIKTNNGIVLDTMRCYDKAGSSSGNLIIEDQESQTEWAYRSLSTRTLASEIGIERRRTLDGFYSTTFAAEKAMELLKIEREKNISCDSRLEIPNGYIVEQFVNLRRRAAGLKDDIDTYSLGKPSHLVLNAYTEIFSFNLE